MAISLHCREMSKSATRNPAPPTDLGLRKTTHQHGDHMTTAKQNYYHLLANTNKSTKLNDGDLGLYVSAY